MSLEIARQAIDFVFTRSLLFDETINIGWFGGEPLLEFDRVKQYTALVKAHPLYDPDRVVISIVSNGTAFNREIGQFLKEEGIIYGISCDGPPEVQDRYRKFKNGRGSSRVVERNIRRAHKMLGHIMVNAVFTPETAAYLPDTIQYFSDLGVRQIYLSPDYSAYWDEQALAALPEIYEKMGDLYQDFYRQGNPHYISLIDNKISVILRNGYDALDKCRMGIAEFAITPDGKVFPCERLVGDGNNDHQIGHVFTGINHSCRGCHTAEGAEMNEACLDCSLNSYCINWCGCSNYMTSGYYNRVSAFSCLSEKAILKTSFRVFRELEEELGPIFYKHMVGEALLNAV